ncbi:hypothetical protein FGG08_006861 [Glutinoglossum americanum]|uniref:DUF3669 domain-containing protein n=1 Tax=Glutinoglossum americanum TaxID=1670608 RepID=A0A9P8KX15_9PEZI|nr:hypothetical protein FGG08_006861 [Glutinoglossum americanum]
MHTVGASNMLELRRIGAGFCGSVWAPTQGDPSAFKREDGGPGRSLFNDFEMHMRVLESLDRLTGLGDTDLSLHIQVPQCYRFIEATDQEWWNKNLTSFPRGYSPCNVLHSERIPPLPQNIREFLIDEYCPTPLISEIKASDANQDCLIRPYLGRRRITPSNKDWPSRYKAFSLRNFPLHEDQMEDLGIGADITTCAEMMAETLAMIHWYGGLDANDVEFVLAPPRNGTQPRLSNALGGHTMWLLDFDCCRWMTMDAKGVDQAVTAFLRNDPFYPRPGQPLWEKFRDRYLQVSSNIVIIEDKRRKPLPEMFIGRVEEAQWKRNERRVP